MTRSGLVSLLSWVIVAGCSTPAPAPAPAAQAGVEPGPLTQATIGPSGGAIAAAYGGLTVDVPPGAVTSNVKFTVQSVPAPGAGSVGQVFELEPSGTLFALPVVLSFHYLAADLGGRAPAGLAAATYVAGRWSPVHSQVDAAGLTVTASVTHFSPWGLVFAPAVAGADASSCTGSSSCGADSGAARDASDASDAAPGDESPAVSDDASPTLEAAADDSSSTDATAPPPDAARSALDAADDSSDAGLDASDSGAALDSMPSDSAAPPDVSSSYTIGGVVSGLAAGDTLVLKDDGGDDLIVRADGPFTFAAPLANASAYAVTVSVSPASPHAQTCAVVAAGSGFVANADVTNVQVSCLYDFAIGGTVTGLAPGDSVVLQNSGGDDLTVGADGTFTFPMLVTTGKGYAASVLTQPSAPAQTCAVSGASGVVGSGDVTSVAVTCSTNRYIVGGTVSGLASGDGFVLRDNGGDDLTVSADGTFTFATPVASGQGYAASVFAQPSTPAGTCIVAAGGSGTVTSAGVTSVQITCTYPATALAAGWLHTCALDTGGTVRCWGNDNAGQLGNGTTTQALTPADVPGIQTATAIGAEYENTCVLEAGGTVKCWGLDNEGQIGNGIPASPSGASFWYTSPVDVSGVTTATAIAVGQYHACALLADGTVRCWGYNTSGQLGNGTNVASSTAVRVSGISGATAIAAGDATTCALVASGAVECWGLGFAGALGNGGTANSSTPVTVSGVSGAVALASKNAETCALLSNGTVLCWGYNSNGQLGNGTNTSSPTPVAVYGLAGATAIAVGEYHACAVVSGGAVECWGAGTSGQLGNAGSTDSWMPVSVSGLAGAVGLAAGEYYSCAVLADGSVKCWGANGNGQLGNGTTTGAPTPVAVSW